MTGPGPQRRVPPQMHPGHGRSDPGRGPGVPFTGAGLGARSAAERARRAAPLPCRAGGPAGPRRVEETVRTPYRPDPESPSVADVWRGARVPNRCAGDARALRVWSTVCPPATARDPASRVRFRSLRPLRRAVPSPTVSGAVPAAAGRRPGSVEAGPGSAASASATSAVCDPGRRVDARPEPAVPGRPDQSRSPLPISRPASRTFRLTGPSGGLPGRSHWRPAAPALPGAGGGAAGERRDGPVAAAERSTGGEEGSAHPIPGSQRAHRPGRLALRQGPGATPFRPQDPDGATSGGSADSPAFALAGGPGAGRRYRTPSRPATSDAAQGGRTTGRKCAGHGRAEGPRADQLGETPERRVQRGDRRGRAHRPAERLLAPAGVHEDGAEPAPSPEPPSSSSSPRAGRERCDRVPGRGGTAA